MKTDSPSADLLPAMPQIAGIKLAVAQSNTKYKNRDDLLLIQFAPNSYVAGSVTKSSMPGAPIIWSKPILKLGRAEVLLVNAGNANVLTGQDGLDATQKIATCLAENLNLKTEHILQASTGVIGEKLADDAIIAKIPELCQNLSDDASLWHQAAGAIMTTDIVPKMACATSSILDTPVNIAGIAKGSGMIAPNMATMLGFIFTDALIAPHSLQKITKRLVEQTFNCITVDGDCSTSDMVVVVATGMADNQLTDAPEALTDFTEKLHQIMLTLAQKIVRDGEGARKFITINVEGAKNDESARIIGKSIANSPLVKTAIAGGDANWGRIVMAIGKSGEPATAEDLSINIDAQQILHKGALQDFDAARLDQYFATDNITLNIDIGLGNGKGTIYSCDLTEDYIKINADYRS